MPEDDAAQGVWPEHAEAVNAWLAVSTQLRLVAYQSGIRALGLDYVAAQAGFALAGLQVTPPLWDKIRLIEIGARNALNGETT